MLRRKPKPTREQLLAAAPVKNPAVRETHLSTSPEAPLSTSVLRLSAPLKPSPLRTFLTQAPRQKSFDLDPLGAFVWQNADGTRTVESLIHLFAAHHQLSLREAEIPVLAFLQTLLSRNLLALKL